MKKLMPLIMIMALLFGGYYVYTNYLGGSVSGPTNTPAVDVPDVQAPDIDDVGDAAGDAASKAEEGAKQGADTIAGLDPAFWRILALLLVVGAVLWLWKDPKRRALSLGLVVVGLIVFIVSRQ